MADAASPAPPTPSEARAGVVYALLAYSAWGICPVYFKAVAQAPALEVLAHRVIFGAVLLAALLGWKRRWAEAVSAVRAPATLARLLLTTVLIACNWYLFIWAVASGHVIEASLGYFINPLVSVAFGVLLLGERLSRPQAVAIALAALGVVVLTIDAGKPPWVSLALAGSFGLYTLLRRGAAVSALPGLAVETALMLPAAVVLLLWLESTGRARFLGESVGLSILLPLAGVVTIVPLWWFTEGARRIRLSTLGLLQYLAPSGQLLLGVFAYGERFTHAHGVTMACIWSGLALFSWDALRRSSSAVSRRSPRG